MQHHLQDEIAAGEDPTLSTTNPATSSGVAAVVEHWGSDWMARQLWARQNTASSAAAGASDGAIGAAGDETEGYSPSNPPMCMFHGTSDTVVPFANETSRITAG